MSCCSQISYISSISISSERKLLNNVIKSTSISATCITTYSTLCLCLCNTTVDLKYSVNIDTARHNRYFVVSKVNLITVYFNCHLLSLYLLPCCETSCYSKIAYIGCICINGKWKLFYYI